jgi:hypothetical protein
MSNWKYTDSRKTVVSRINEAGLMESCLVSEIQGLIDEGYEPELPAETPEQIISRLELALDRHLDAVAKEYRYESIRAMVSYMGDPNPKFDKEGTAAKFWRSAVYTYGIEVIAAVQNGNRDIPTKEELLAEIPQLEDFL